MALAINLHFATFSPGGQLPGSALSDIGGWVSALYEETCAGELSLNPLLRDDISPPSTETYAHAADLHFFARELNGNPEYWGDPRPTGPPVKNVSVIYADRYGPHNTALGVMFDRGFVTSDDGSNSAMFTGVPREACAIFVGRIGDIRSTDADLIQEAWFTTLHELGHVFNLTHTENELTFLSASDPDRAYSDDEVSFNAEQTHWLQNCSRDPYVWPGGSRFADSGPTGHLNCGRKWSTRSFPFGLDLVIDTSLREFQRFFPVELDVTLKTANGVTRRYSVPHTLDPGYDNFRIWIEEPDGSRRLYQSPRRYCHNGERLTVSPKKPFRRDISIFGEAGGYTFRVPGVHQLWCEFDVGPRGVIRSNILEVNILPSSLMRDDPVEAILTDRLVPQVLYHRVDPSRGRALHRLRRACELLPKSSGALAALRYAMGRAWLSETLRESRAKDTTLRKAAASDLTAAAQSNALGDHRLEKISTLMDLVSRQDVDREQLVWCRDD